MLAVFGVWWSGQLLSCRSAPERAAPIEARLELAAGDVRAGHTDPLPTAMTGAAIGAHDRLETGPGARAMARLSDGTALVLRADSAVALDGPAVRAVRGELFVDAAPAETRESAYYLAGNAEIRADDAAFFLDLDEKGGRVVVTRGELSVVVASGRVEVSVGEQAVFGASDAAPAVSPVSYRADWTGGMADHGKASDLTSAGTGRIYGVGGAVARPLDIARQDVRTVVRAGLMETEVDQTFFNPSGEDLEGWYWFRLPQGAMVTSYAVEFGGQMVEGEFVERDRAKAAYGAASTAGLEPSLLEWVDSHTVRAKINPIPAMGTRRVILRFFARCDRTDDTLRVTYPLRSDDPSLHINEFSLTVDLGEEGSEMALSTLQDASVEEGGRRVTMRRTNFVPRADFLLEGVIKKKPAPLRASRYSAGGQTADYVMVRYQPDIDWESVGPQPADVVLLVDTSAGIDEASQKLQAQAVEAVLRTLSGEDRFALVALDVTSTVLHPETGLAKATEESASRALERLSEHGHAGATDLSSSFDLALGLLHDSAQPAIVYIGDGLATTGDLGGEALRRQLTRALSSSRARFYALGIGPAANHALLGELARSGGGLAWSVSVGGEITDRALWLAAEIKTPTLTDLVLDLGAGMDSLFDTSGGKARAGEEILVVGRTHHPLPDSILVRGMLGGKPVTFEETTEGDDPLVAAFAPKLWAQASIEHRLGSADRPDDLWGEVARTGIEYGLLTPYSSVLVLENDAAYQRMGVPRVYRPLRGARLLDLASTGASAAWTSSLGCRGSEQSPTPAEQSVMAPPGGVAGELPPPDVDFDRMQKAKGRPRRQEIAAGKQDESKDELADELATLGYLAVEEPQEGEKRPLIAAQGCSDKANRPLAQRIPLWRRSIASGLDLASLYQEALMRCEIENWASEATLVDLMADALSTPDAANNLMAALYDRKAARERLASDLMRKATDPELLAVAERALAAPGAPDWSAIEAEIARIPDPEARLTRVKAALAQSSGVTLRGERLLVRVLAEANRRDELEIVIQHNRERSLLSPLMARETGDALALLGDKDGAIRAYSEMVEFDPFSVAARETLGDLLLAHGWYDAAYRQYETLSERGGGERATLRQAIAARGASRTDEALRLLRSVSSSPSRRAEQPGDMGTIAELWTAAIVAELIVAAPPAGDNLESERLADDLRRTLKELPFFRAPAELWVLTWEQLTSSALDRLGAAWVLPAGQGQPIDGAVMGATGLLLPRNSGIVPRPVSSGGSFQGVVHKIIWDGTHFEVHTEQVTLSPGAS